MVTVRTVRFYTCAAVRTDRAADDMKMLSGKWQVFLAGMLCGAVLTVAVAATLLGWGDPQRSAREDAMRDNCLSGGKTAVTCDAILRVFKRDHPEAF
jgi:hypothetical protein